jgi:DNA adenine methylase
VAHAGRLVDLLRTQGPLLPPTTPAKPEFQPGKPTAGRLYDPRYRLRLNEFNRCNICWEPAAIANQYGRFCGLKCFRVWQGMPADEVLTDAVTLDPAVEAKLTRIWPEAERLGWSHERIWNVHFWPNIAKHPRGLATVLQPGDSITEVTEACIIILARGGHLLRFPQCETFEPSAAAGTTPTTSNIRHCPLACNFASGCKRPDACQENQRKREQEQPKTAQPPLKTEPERTDATFELTQLREAEIDHLAAMDAGDGNDINGAVRSLVSMSSQPSFHFTTPTALKPPLKWAGGKRLLVPEFSELWSKHKHRRLVEPFCGAAAITLGMRPDKALLNDINRHLMNFHRWLQCGLTIDIPMEYDREFYDRSSARFNQLANNGGVNSKEAASLFYYLNHTCFNGLCRFNRNGQFNVPFGKYKGVNYRREFAEYQQAYVNWTLSTGHFLKTAVEPDDFIYADPPYDGSKSAFVGYAGIPFNWQDQVALARWLAQHPGPVVTSNAATERITALYRELGFTLTTRQVARAINSKGEGRGAVAEMLAIRNL